jgi:hypothetical protein
MVTTSETIQNLAAALAAFQGEMPAVALDAQNPFLKNRYASLAQIVKTCAPHLAKHGLAVCQMPTEHGLVTRVLHTSGEWMQSCLPYPAAADEKGKSPAQLMGSNITYMRRYAYSAVLGIVADEDNDGNQPPQQPGKQPGKQPPPPPAAPEKPWLNDNSEAFTKAVAAIESGKYAIPDIEKKYRISKAVLAKLEQVSAEVNAGLDDVFPS